MEMIKSLKERASQLTAQLELMEGRTKGETDQLLNINVTVTDFGFLSGDNGDYVVFTIKEDPSKFFFGGGVLTSHIQELDKEGYKQAIQSEGLPIRLEKKKSKANRLYTNVIFYPEN